MQLVLNLQSQIRMLFTASYNKGSLSHMHTHTQIQLVKMEFEYSYWEVLGLLIVLTNTTLVQP